MSRKDKALEMVKAGLLKAGVFALCVGALPFSGIRSAFASAKETGEQEEARQGTFLEASEVIPVPVAQGLSGAERAALPDKYDPRDKGWLTSVKDQGKWGTCWAHACAAAMEYSLIKKGEADVDEIDLSERHLAYFMYNTPTDPLGNAVGDKNILLDENKNYLDAGADSRQAALTLANWIGLADEQVAPYDETNHLSNYNDKTLPAPLDEELAYQDVAHLANSYWISPANRDGIKQELMNTGAAFISLMFPQDLKGIYNEETYAFNNTTGAGGGHAGLVVGWDDSFPKESFPEGSQPQNDGAWLVRNSWGKSWGDNGYYWVSYEDAFTSDPQKSSFVFLDAESADNYDHNYYYDGTFSLVGHGVTSGGSFANVYTAKGGGEAERLEAVGFAPYDTDVNYAIQIYTDIKNDKDPESGERAFDEPQTGKISYSGYCTIPLDQPVDLPEGCKFSIVITLSKAADKGQEQVVSLWTDESITYFHDLKEENEDNEDGSDQKKEPYLECSASQSEGQSFYKFPDYAWADTVKSPGDGNSTGFTFRIKGYTVDLKPISSFTMEKSVDLIESEERELAVSIFPGEASARMLKWSTSDQTVATVDKKGTVTAVGEGTCDITASYGSITNTCKVTVRKRPAKATGLKIMEATTDTAKFAWTGQVNIDGYEVYRRQLGKENWLKVGTVDKTKISYEDTELQPATTYEYAVRAYVNTSQGKAIYGELSDSLEIHTVQKPEKVEDFHVTEKGDTYIKVQWTAQPGVDGYIVEWGKNEEGESSTYDQLQGSENTSYDFEDLDPDTEYMCIVYAYVNSYAGKWITYADDKSITEDNILEAIAYLFETTNKTKEPDDGEDNPGKDDPGKDDPGKDDPGKDDPVQQDPEVEALKVEIQEALTAIEAQEITDDDYTQESWEKYAEALNSLKALMMRDDVTLEELQAAQISLAEAIDHLVSREDDTEHDESANQPTDWKLDKEKAVLYVSESLQLNVTGTSESVVWKSSDTKIAAVSADGKVKAKKKGKVTITATLGGVTKSCALQVKASVTASKAKLTLAAGKKKKATVTLALGKKLKVKVKSKKIASCTVGKLKGKKCSLTVQGKKKGKTTITVTNKTTKEKITINVIVK